jgi:hypothetical protein
LARAFSLTRFLIWGDQWGLNPRHPEPQSGVLPLNYGRHV